MNVTPNPFVMAAICADVTCKRMDWATGADQGTSSKVFQVVLKSTRAMFDKAEANGNLAEVYANYLGFLTVAPAGRIRENIDMLLSGGQDSILACVRRPWVGN